MHKSWLIAGAATLALLAAGCENQDKGPAAEAVAAASASPEAADIASTAASGTPCPTAAQSKDWHAAIDRTPPVPEGGRPLSINGRVELTKDGYSAELTPSEIDSAAHAQHFLLEIVPETTSEKGWRQISTGAYPAPAGVTKAIVDCGGKVLAEAAVEIVQ